METHADRQRMHKETGKLKNKIDSTHYTNEQYDSLLKNMIQQKSSKLF